MPSRLQMSPPIPESMNAIAHDSGITITTLYSCRSKWQQRGLLVPATNLLPEQWRAVDKLAAVL
jgi:hypothetical protein